jgi:hypothetical protein
MKIMFNMQNKVTIVMSFCDVAIKIANIFDSLEYPTDKKLLAIVSKYKLNDITIVTLFCMLNIIFIVLCYIF